MQTDSSWIHIDPLEKALPMQGPLARLPLYDLLQILNDWFTA